MHVPLANLIEEGQSRAMSQTVFRDIRDSLRKLYLEDSRPWLVGFSGGKDSTMLASLVFEVVLSISAEQRTKPVSLVCTDTRGHRAFGLPNDLLSILKDDLNREAELEGIGIASRSG